MSVLELVVERQRSSDVALKTVLPKVFSFPVVLGAALVTGIYVPLRAFAVDPDVWWHIRVGETILATHRWPTTDPYSFTAYGSPWIAYEWLGEVLLAAVNRLGGVRALLALNVILAGAVVAALYCYASMRSRNAKAAFVAVVALLPIAYLSFTLRPQMLGYLFLVLTLIILERFRQGHTRDLWLLPPLFLLWVNAHGTFVFGLFALGVYWGSGLVDVHWGGLESRLWTEAERKRLALASLLSFLALLITPYGTKLAAYPLDMAFSQPVNVANIQEWQPVAFELFYGKLFLFLLVGFIVAQVTLRLKWRLEEFTLFVVGLVALCLHVRFVLIFVPFFVPLLATVLAKWVPPYEPHKDPHALNAVLLVGMLGAVLWFFPSRAKINESVGEHFPVGALHYLRQHPVPGHMYNTYGYGGYLIYAARGPAKVFIDGRADIYERLGVLSDYLNIARVAENTLILLRAYNIQSCLIDRGEALATVLAASPEWQRVYGDKTSLLFVRRSPANAAGAGK
ncbi:MAG TPA: hypothetical protein VGZ29_04135 [Terriglobia bacterium]|nr:hypothetical protein [Terriglobia bacterium]